MLVMKAAEKQEVQFSTLPIQTRQVLAIFTSWDVLTASQTNNPVYWIPILLYSRKGRVLRTSICVVVACVVMQYVQVYLNFAINGEVQIYGNLIYSAASFSFSNKKILDWKMGFEVEKQCSLGTCFFFANSSYLLWQCRICLCAVRAFFLLQLASFVINGIVLNLLRFWILFQIKKIL